MNQINISGSKYAEHYHATLRLHQAINQFKHKEADKFILRNKLNILNQKCQKNKKRTRLIESQIEKISKLKQTYTKNKEDILHCLSMEKENQKQKIERGKSLRNIAKQNMKFVRNMIVRGKSEEYLKIKEKKRQNQMRITQNIQKSLHQKREKSLQIKLYEEEMRLSRTIFMQKKRLKTQKSSQHESKPLELGTKITDNYIQQMKQLERQMIQRYAKTNENLTKSMIKKRKMLS